MANRHFAELGDVWKHLPLAEILQINPPRHYWETHAGSPFYPLAPSPARLRGALRFMDRAPADEDLAACSYLKAMQARPGNYPGSPAIALHQLGAESSYVFCDVDAESAQALREHGGNFAVRVINEDGVAAIAREAQRNEFRPESALILIDPFDPDERMTPGAMTPVELAAMVARRGFRLFYWYGYDSIADRGWARRAISELAPAVDLWCGDILMPAQFVYPNRSGPWGCGIVLANMTEMEMSACARLGAALERINAGDIVSGNEPPSLSFRVISNDV